MKLRNLYTDVIVTEQPTYRSRYSIGCKVKFSNRQNGATDKRYYFLSRGQVHSMLYRMGFKEGEHKDHYVRFLEPDKPKKPQAVVLLEQVVEHWPLINDDMCQTVADIKNYLKKVNK